MRRDFQRLAIINRGEPAMRLIHAVREYNHEHQTQIQTIAFYTEPDQHAMFVREADEAYNLGPATFIDTRDGERKITYLNYEGLKTAMTETRTEAVWVGWGFVAEHAAFADLCAEMGVVFIGPSGDVMRRLGDKITSKLLAEEAQVPVSAWSGGAVHTYEDALTHAAKLGYPLMIKATAGGGGRGIRKVHNQDELKRAFESARSEALKSFGNADVFMEQLVQAARHVEVQIIGDHAGKTWSLGVRDCSIQRRHQKVLEETPSTALTAEQDQEIQAAAVRLGQKVGYQNAGTVEFLYEPEAKRFSFMEVNARLQVEHPVSELTTGADLVKLQIHVARGGTLEGPAPVQKGHAIEVRVNAEDPDNRFAPAPGRVAVFRLPNGPGIRVDTGVEEGDLIAPEFDSMIAKIMAYGRDRNEALARLTRALSEGTVIIEGGMSNKGFLLELLSNPQVKEGAYDVGWLDLLVAQGKHQTARHADVALIHAAIEAYESEIAIDKAQFLAAAARGRPEANTEIGRKVELGYHGNTYSMMVHKTSPRHYRIEVDGHDVYVETEKRGRAEQRLLCGDQYYRIFSTVEGVTHFVEVNGIPHKISRDEGGVIRSPAPSVVVSVEVEEGEMVEAGDRLIVLEAMKMEMAVTAKFAGKVREVMVRSNVQVGPGVPMIVLEPTETETTTVATDRLDFTHLDTVSMQDMDLATRCRFNMSEAKSLLLGYDVDPADVKRILIERNTVCLKMPVDDPDLLKLEYEILNLFVDTTTLFHRIADRTAGNASERLGAESYLFTYLRDLAGKGASLPSGFVDKLKHLLSYYQVENLDHTSSLEDSLFRIYKAHQRTDQQVNFVLNILERRLTFADQLREKASNAFRVLLNRMVVETQADYPALNDLAREVRYRFYTQPMLVEVKEGVYAEATEHLDALEKDPNGPDRAAHVKALLNCTQPMKTTLMQRVEGASPEQLEYLLEVMTRRYYRIREIESLQTYSLNGHSLCSGTYHFQDKKIHVVTAFAFYDQLGDVASTIATQIADIPLDEDVVIDYYLWCKEQGENFNKTPEELLEVLNDVPFPRRIRRMVVSITDPTSGRSMGDVQHMTFRPSETGYFEQTFYRGLHPMMAKRLRLWRLENFNIDRLKSPNDVYLFHAVAKENPRDERLIGVAEVRDLTPVRDESGRITHLPELERMLMEVVSGFRHFQSQRSKRQRLHWNRIQLYIWPPFELRTDELNDLVNKLAPATEGLGLEAAILHARVPHPEKGELRRTRVIVRTVGESGVVIEYRKPADKPIKPLDAYTQKVVTLRRRGLIYPYELIRMLTPSRNGAQMQFPAGSFQEYDLNEENKLVPVDRQHGQNTANIVVGVIKHYTTKYPEGMKRVALISDPTYGMGSLAEAECRRIMEGLNLAEEMGVPLEWYAVSAGAKIAMDSGTENMDWISAVLRKLIEFTQDGGEVNILVLGINVGAQPYWNAEATMLMHTRGILVMIPQAAMVLTGKQALDYSGGVSAEDNLGIGGYERIMGPNGQAQYFARDVTEACQVLLRYYDHTYVYPGERFPRRASTTDPIKRDVRSFPHGRVNGLNFTNIGEVFSKDKNPGRKKAFDIRKVMEATIDQDHEPLERWYRMRDAEIGVVWDAHLGGNPVCLIGLESRPIPRLGFIPADGPDQWTSGTLFPQSSKKVARAINAANNNRPVVVLANLSGFDGSPESMRLWQLEYGAEIGRAVVNFKGPIIFCVVSRYHGGAFVVFSGALNESMEIIAVEGAYASVIGGAPAAAVVFAREVRKRAQNDPRVLAMQTEITEAEGAAKVKLMTHLKNLRQEVHSEHLGKVAEEFDAIHSIYRAQKVGSVDTIIPAEALRPYLIEAVERGMKKTIEKEGLEKMMT